MDIKQKKQKSKRGGARPGAGPKRGLEGGRRETYYFDDPTIEIMKRFGSGSVSTGIRRAAIVLEFLGAKFEEYKTLAIIEDEKRISARKEAQRKEEE